MALMRNLNGLIEFSDSTTKNRYQRLNMGLHFPFAVRSQVESKVLRQPGDVATIRTGIIIPRVHAERIEWAATPHLFKGKYTLRLSDDDELLLVATHGSRHSQQFRQNDLLGKLTVKEFNPWTDGKEAAHD